MADRRILTRRGRMDVRVWVVRGKYAAELLGGSLTAFGKTADEAVTRLAEAVERQHEHG